MSKKNNKKGTSFIDKITLQNLKWIIVICLILSILCEFVPSLFDICKLFNYHPIILFLQPHKDFFTNIMLGCLGSAVISYIMLLIPNKIKEQEEIEETSLHIKNVVSSFWRLYCVLESAKSQISVENLNCFEEKIELERDNLSKSLTNLYNYKKDNNINNEIIDNIVNKLFPIIKEVNIFIDVYKISKQQNNKYPINLYNEIFSILLNELYKNYDLEELKQEFEKIVPYTIVLLESLKEIPYAIMEHDLITKEFNSSMFYTREIYNVYEKYGKEITKEILNNLKKEITEFINQNINLMNYGEKIMDGENITYIVNEKRMSIDEYKDYCINQELKKRGLT